MKGAENIWEIKRSDGTYLGDMETGHAMLIPDRNYDIYPDMEDIVLSLHIIIGEEMKDWTHYEAFTRTMEKVDIVNPFRVMN